MEKEVKLIRVVIEKYLDGTDNIDTFTNENEKIFINISDGDLTITKGGYAVAYYPKGNWLRAYINYTS